MKRPNILAVPPGHDTALAAARHILERTPREALAQVLILVPNRRAAIALRDAFRKGAGGVPLLLPRTVPLAELKDALPVLLGTETAGALRTLPAAMPEWQRLCLLAAQVRAFERKRIREVTLEQSLRLAADLAALQDSFTRYRQPLTMERLQALVSGDFAEHWQQSLSFLSIVAETWPSIEAAYGMTTAERSQQQAAALLTARWKAEAPSYPVYIVGSTASQPATAELMQCVAELEQGAVLLPGLDTHVPMETAIAGHPCYHIKLFLERWASSPATVTALGEASPVSALWHSALGDSSRWHKAPAVAQGAWQSLHLVPCQHPEEEARAITLLLREAADIKDRTAALITPDEGLMDRVAAQLMRYGIVVDRLSSGTLATTQTGSLLAALMDAIAAPERALPLLNLFRHELVRIGEAAAWHTWLQAAEIALRGVATAKPGELPHILEEEPLTKNAGMITREIYALSQSRFPASGWVHKLAALLKRMVPEPGSGQEAIEEALDALGFADLLGPLDHDAFAALLARQLKEPWRSPALNAHPNLFMLTPVEARLMAFDRVILANMQASQWPGMATPGPWLNFSQQQALGLPAPEERMTLMAHDLLMQGSAKEVFLSWPRRDGGAPTIRSPFLEKLVAFLELHGVEETTITDTRTVTLARLLYASGTFVPEEPAMPRPPKHQRPRTLSVTAIDTLFSDPYSIYARYVLGLKPLDAPDAEPEASDFGTLAHKAIKQLSGHWDTSARAATEPELAAIADTALRRFSHRSHVQLFWRKRLLNALRFVNGQEQARRTSLTSVMSEMSTEKVLHFPDGASLALHGRIDRLERQEESVTIADYKTGKAPSTSEVEQGKAAQLLAYALLLAEAGEQVTAVSYWELPRANHEGEVRTTGCHLLEELLPRLRAALATMLNEMTPFLARPGGKEERFENDYDGISRYDEWAG